MILFQIKRLREDLTNDSKRAEHLGTQITVRGIYTCNLTIRALLLFIHYLVQYACILFSIQIYNDTTISIPFTSFRHWDSGLR